MLIIQTQSNSLRNWEILYLLEERLDYGYPNSYPIILMT